MVERGEGHIGILPNHPVTEKQNYYTHKLLFPVSLQFELPRAAITNTTSWVVQK